MKTLRFSWPHVIAGVAMVAALGAAQVMTPRLHAVPEGSVDLERMVPREFGDWREVRTGAIQVDLTPRDGAAASLDQPYDQTLMRTYVRRDGAAIMLALAYGRTQRQEIKIHRPELCYFAQGLDIQSKSLAQVSLSTRHQIPAYRLVAKGPRRLEPVTYWVRIGRAIPLGAWQSRLEILREGMRGVIPDGILVRVSQVQTSGDSMAESYRIQDEFLRDLVAAVDPAGRRILTGTDEA